jgi:hypothetical protein
MAFLRFNENNMVLDVVVGINEEYRPTEKNTELLNRVEALRTKMEEWKIKEQEFLANELGPVIKNVHKEVVEINEETYPELKERREARELESKTSGLKQ